MNLGAVVDRTTAWRDRELDDARHGERTAAVLGLALGISFTVCFLTGLLSHLIQHPPGWFVWVPRPVGLYRVTQGVHVATGIAAVPLLFAKLWSVFPRLFQTPVVRDVGHALERLSLLPLVGGAVFMLVTGIANIDLWYPWPFFFPAGHYWVAWITIGALIVHIGAKIRVTRRVLRRTRAGADGAEAPDPGAVDRRRFLTWVGVGSATLTLVTIGQTVGPLKRFALLAPRSPDTGTQGFPVNKTAIEAGVVDAAVSADFRLTVEGAVSKPLSFTVADLQALPQHSATLPIACVEGWSASRRRTGIPLRDVVALAGGAPDSTVTVVSLEPPGLYNTSTVNRRQLADIDTLLALEVDGDTLHADHGYPLRLIAPNRPGVMQTKWVHRVVVS